MLNGECSSGCQALGRLIELRLTPSGSRPLVFDAAEHDNAVDLHRCHTWRKLSF